LREGTHNPRPPIPLQAPWRAAQRAPRLPCPRQSDWAWWCRRCSSAAARATRTSPSRCRRSRVGAGQGGVSAAVCEVCRRAQVNADSLLDRIQVLVRASSIFVIMQGERATTRAGTGSVSSPHATPHCIGAGIRCLQHSMLPLHRPRLTSPSAPFGPSLPTLSQRPHCAGTAIPLPTLPLHARWQRMYRAADAPLNRRGLLPSVYTQRLHCIGAASPPPVLPLNRRWQRQRVFSTPNIPAPDALPPRQAPWAR
jgi:hypothetical protein